MGRTAKVPRKEVWRSLQDFFGKTKGLEFHHLSFSGISWDFTIRNSDFNMIKNHHSQYEKSPLNFSGPLISPQPFVQVFRADDG